jgi:hypothetical protein
MKQLKAGVDISNLTTQALYAMDVVDDVFEFFGVMVTRITSVCDRAKGRNPKTLHQVGRAFDVGLPPEGIEERVVDKSKRLLGDNFDVVLEEDHIHIEYDPEMG